MEQNNKLNALITLAPFHILRRKYMWSSQDRKLGGFLILLWPWGREENSVYQEWNPVPHMTVCYFARWATLDP